MIELIIVITILAILCGLSAVGFLTWQDWATFKKENEYAKTFFVAAQNQLAEYSSNGRLEEMRSDLLVESGQDSDGNIVYAVKEGIHTAALTDEELSSIWSNAGGKSDVIVSLSASAGSYDEYLNNPDGCSRETYWIFELLGNYVYDTGILNNGAVRVEFTPEDGQVLDVFYSDKHETFSPEESGAKDYVDATNRDEEYRRSNMIGYYGVDTLSKSLHGVGEKKEKLKISKVRLYNEETLYTTFKVKDLGTINSIDENPEYTVTVVSEDKKDLLAITVKGVLKNEQAKVSENEVKATVKRAGDNAADLGEIPVLAWIEEDSTVHVVLDAADIAADTRTYNAGYEDLLGSAKTAAAKAEADKFRQTYSFFRFGLDVQNIFIKVEASAKDYQKAEADNYSKRLIKQTKNTCFAGNKNDNYSIRNARHLYNIRYMEVAKAYDERTNGTGKKQASEGVTFTLNENIDWGEFQHSQAKASESKTNIVGYLYDSSCDTNTSVSRKLAGFEYIVARINCEFPSIPTLRANDTLDGNGKTITGISVTEKANEIYSIYYNANSNATNIRPTGFININYGTIKDLKLDQLTVSGDKFVGGLVGVNVGKVSNIELLNTDNSSSVIGQSNVGGIIGAQLVTNKASRKTSLTVFDVQQNQNITEEYLLLTKLTNRAPVEGVTAVGGIIGEARNDFAFIINDKKHQIEEEFDGLDGSELNYLKSNGNNKKAAQNVAVTNCVNYGAVQGCYSLKATTYNSAYMAPAGKKERKNQNYNVMSDGENVETIRYIGGIAGYSYNSDTTSTHRVVLQECTSSPQYDDAAVGQIFSAANADGSNLYGTYVGGILGYNYFGQIDSCLTKPEKGTYGYVFGYKYVGGVVGFNAGPASGITGGSGKQGTNYNHVVAYEYAGGITGCSSDVQDVDSRGENISGEGKKDPESLVGILLADSERNLLVKVRNWTNKGVVIAIHQYAGGITGFNAGMIYGCNSEIDAGLATSMFETLKTGDYSGGITGYNNGVVGNSERDNSGKLVSKGSNLDLICYVRGNNYVGGVVGYNDVDAVVEDYTVKSGNVYAEKGSCFTGGYVGLNASIDLLMNKETKEPRMIKCNPTAIEGSYLVGGIIGGNIINTNSWGTAPITGVFKTDNYYGDLEGNEFVGGFVGFNMLLNSSDPEIVDEVQKTIVKAFKESDEGTIALAAYGISAAETDANDVEQEKLREKVMIAENIHDVVKHVSGKDYADSKVVLYISGEGEQSTSSRLNVVRAQAVVGGVLGYVDHETQLYVKNIDNATPVEATNHFAYLEEQPIFEGDKATSEYRKTNYAGDDFVYTYSYAGGIIGKVGMMSTLDHCSNVGLGTVKTEGTYTGGLAEINEGTIKNCIVKTMGKSDTDYIGGLCGLNKKTGLITECSMSNQTIGGRNVVGGIAAENYGEISKIALSNAKTTAAGTEVERKGETVRDGVTGLCAAYNGTSGIIILETNIEKATVKSSGQYAGFVTGYNSGFIENRKTGKPDATRSNNLEIRGTIEGYQAVGALCGCNDDQNKDHVVYNFTNYANVKTTMGQAGGIIGINVSRNTIEYCENRAIVVATDGGNSGGITSVNSSLITECYDFAEVTAPNGMCGGIVSLNDKGGRIIKCYVEPDKASVLKFTSNYAVGGVAAQNAGLIENNYLKNVVITNNNRVTGTRMGTVCGENLLTGEIHLADTLRITQSSERPEIENCKVRAESNNCKMGGIAGSNAGIIQGAIDQNDESKISSVIDCTLEFGLATYGSMGGVAGCNAGRIDHVSVDGHIDGLNGDENNGYGGIVGYSGFATKDAYAAAKAEYEKELGKAPENLASITNCTFDGTLHAVGSSGTMAEIGGIAGFNGIGSTISKCYIGVRDDKEIASSGNETLISAGNISKDYTVNGTDKLSGSHTGGIAGTNKGKITDCDNNLHSKDNVKIISFAGDAGGIVGVNDRGGIVSGYAEGDKIYRVTTGGNWSLDMRCAENNHGPGGIIGRNESGHDIEYVDNYGAVSGKYQANIKCGGIVGSNQQKEVGQITFRYCNNYGTVVGYGCTGGFIGQEWLRGCIFDHCVNYGEVYAYEESEAKQRYVGGFVASFKAANTDMSFISCQNHGYIHCGTYKSGSYNLSISGFVGYLDDEINITGYMNDCVNTGIIEYTDPTNNRTYNGSAFVSEPNGNMTWYLTLCRNYNTKSPSINPGFNGGFISKGKGGKLVIKDCLDVSNLKATGTTPNQVYAPFGDTLGSASVNNYYVDIHSADAGLSNFDSASHGAYFSANKGTNGDNWNVYCGTNVYKYSAYKAYELLFREPSIKNRMKASSNQPLNIRLTPDDSFAGISSFVVYLWNGNDDPMNTAKKEQRFRIIFADEDGTRYEATNGDVVTNLTHTEYKDGSGKKWISVSAPTIGNSAEGILANKVEIKLPTGCDPKKVRSIYLVNSNEVAFYGMGWIPADGTNGKDAVLLSGLSEKNGIFVNNLNFKNNNGAGTAALNIAAKADSYDGYQFKYDMLNWDMYKNYIHGERIRIDSGGTRDVVIDSVEKKESYVGVIDFDIVNRGDVGIDKLHLYFANDADCNSTTLSGSVKSYYYEYGYKLTDINEKVCYVPVSEENLVEDVTDCKCATIDVAGLVASDNLSSTQLKKVELYIKNVGVGGLYFDNKSDRYLYIKGVTYEPEDGSGEQIFATGDLDVAATYNADRNSMSQTGAYSIHRLLTDYATHGGTTAAPYVYTDYDIDNGFNMDANDPINSLYHGDHQQINVFEYTPSSQYSDVENRAGLVFDGAGNASLESDVINSRISVYKDIDPKFVKLIRNMYASQVKLQTPANPSAADNHGYINFTWDRVTTDVNGNAATPYGYEVIISIKDQSGKVVEEKKLFQLEQAGQTRQKLNNLIEIEDDWYVNGYSVYLSVLAVNGARYTDDTTEFDSDPTSPIEIKPDKFRLIEPKVHIEMTADNKMRAILDNREEYLEKKVKVQDATGNETEVSMASVCQITVEYSGYTGEELIGSKYTNNVTFTILPEEGRVSQEAMILRGNKTSAAALGFNLLEAYAEPLPEYVDFAFASSRNNTRGNGFGNDMMAYQNQYTTANFEGFFGESAEAMTYQVRVIGGDDSYIATDIGTYSDEIGTYVYYGNYGSGALHIGGSDGSSIVTASSQISDIPTEWFDSKFNARIEAREHLSYSQMKIIHYGHEVATNVVLDGTKDENQAALAAIRDEYYLGGEGVVYGSPIWENNDLKPGYVLYKNNAGTYDIWYYPAVALAKEEAKKFNDTNSTDMRVYAKYCVDSIVYEPMKGSEVEYRISNIPIPQNNYVNLSDFQEGYWMRRQTDNAISADSSKGTLAYVNYAYSDKKYDKVNQIQTWLPAPMADGSTDDGTIVVTTDESGAKEYTISWDKFYRDNYSWNQAQGKYASEDTRYVSMFGLDNNADLDIPTWRAFREKTGIYESFVEDLKEAPNTDLKRKWINSMMNAYYFTYANARYDVYMIGTTFDGTDVILSKTTVNSPTELDPVTGKTYSIRNQSKVGNTDVVTVTDPTYDLWNYSCTFKDESGSWEQYKTVKVRIMRLGEKQSINLNGKAIKGGTASNVGYVLNYYTGNTGADGNISTFELPRYSEYEIKQKAKLDELNPPTMEPVKENNEYPEYIVRWDGIQKEEQLEDLGGYMIVVQDTDTEHQVPRSYYLIESLKEGSDYKITKDNLGFLVDDENAERIQLLDAEKIGNTFSIHLNLSDYSGKSVIVTVRALARDDMDMAPTEYTHGDESSGCAEMPIYSLAVPKTEQVNCEAVLEDGVLKLTYGDDSRYPMDKDVKIIAAAAVYDTIPDEALQDKSQKAAGDEPDAPAPDGEESVYWNTGALETIYLKSAPLEMARLSDGPNTWRGMIPISSLMTILPEGETEMDPADMKNYSGKYLKLVLKATSSDMIDSPWSDEDIDEATVNYRWIQIPDLIGISTMSLDDEEEDDELPDMLMAPENDLLSNEILPETESAGDETISKEDPAEDESPEVTEGTMDQNIPDENLPETGTDENLPGTGADENLPETDTDETENTPGTYTTGDVNVPIQDGESEGDSNEAPPIAEQT